MNEKITEKRVYHDIMDPARAVDRAVGVRRQDHHQALPPAHPAAAADGRVLRRRKAEEEAQAAVEQGRGRRPGQRGVLE